MHFFLTFFGYAAGCCVYIYQQIYPLYDYDYVYSLPFSVFVGQKSNKIAFTCHFRHRNLPSLLTKITDYFGYISVEKFLSLKKILAYFCFQSKYFYLLFFIPGLMIKVHFAGFLLDEDDRLAILIKLILFVEISHREIYSKSEFKLILMKTKLILVDF